MKILYFDCFSGISGDMTLGALLDLGLDQQAFLNELDKLGLKEYDIEIKRGVKKGITGLDVTVRILHSHQEDHGVDHHHQHVHDVHHKEEAAEEFSQTKIDEVHQHSAHHHHQEHSEVHNHTHVHSHSHDGVGVQRNFREIKELIENSALSQSVKDTALKIFEKLAMAEGKIHGISYDQVHFHEVGAVDSIVDIVGTAICIDMLKPDIIMASPVNVGGGFVKCQHGMFPVPAPATLELLKGIPVYSKNAQGELVTPTGAAILSALCREFVDFPSMVIEKIGYGLGKRDYKVPNCLRVCWGEALKK
ncbi:MAG: pyridinium-3,5-bisthiocarboxylic acid mononucleotide nickel chelatase [Clostridiales bacterium]|nr:pyridinium-3,5-bisthiocarboxylic acid mononucleotide nickel chelatase [Clostridiales bacterium]